jgi:hypothetical protein
VRRCRSDLCEDLILQIVQHGIPCGNK